MGGDEEGAQVGFTVVDSEAEAKAWMEKNDPKAEIVHRTGNYIRCEQYCSVSKFCKQHGAHHAKETN